MRNLKNSPSNILHAVGLAYMKKSHHSRLLNQNILYPLVKPASVKTWICLLTNSDDLIGNFDCLVFGCIYSNDNIGSHSRQCLEVLSCHFHGDIIPCRSGFVKGKMEKYSIGSCKT